ncbi:hypothetical protein BJ322DRAFT_238068 [Thelephora terrestris]|uniref:Uncharacterized protein n=1 Tax=Thelephora terrestris TaxID=56493 RepID=A0A9P6H8F0_9AGAM|nr:hypothetical protein BJ322DRAFT_238068 [Thelephora terrestris]
MAMLVRDKQKDRPPQIARTAFVPYPFLAAITMATRSPQPEERDASLSSLTASIETLHLAEQNSSTDPTKSVFGSVRGLLATIRDSNEQDYIKLGISCADVCQALDRGLDGRRTDELSRPLLGAIEKLTTAVAAIQKQVVQRGKQNRGSPSFHPRNDKDSIAAWGRDLDRVLLIFNTEFSFNNHLVLLDIRRDQIGQGGTAGRARSTQASAPLGELPPPRPRACFGRDGLIEQIVGLAEDLNPIALIGPGGIGKTSIALAVLHHDRVRERFGANRRFIRCDKFPVSRSNFLRRLSKVVGAGIENHEDLDSLRPFLSSEEMFIVLDNAESILDPQGADGKEIYRIVEELSQFSNISLTITSRITTVPPDCETLDVPTLSMEAAQDAFYRIYKRGGRSEAVSDILRQLDYHPLSVTLLATVAHQNKWDNGRLAREWEQRQTGVLRTEHSNSLAAAVELSLASPMFQDLGPDAREILGVVAFFPQGVDENNLGWLFPSISHINTIFDKFCILSLAYRSGGFITMLAPLRDYLRPTNPIQSLLLCKTKDLYSTRLAVEIDHNTPTFRGSRWITLEDVNVEHLFDIFTSIDTVSEDIWDTCSNFFWHLYYHKPRQTILRSKVERLPDDHPSKPICLFLLSRLFGLMGNHTELKSFLLRLLALHRKEENDLLIARTLRELSDANRMLYLLEEGIREAKEALEIMERVGGATDRAMCLDTLARLLLRNNQLDAAEDAISGAIDLWEKGQEYEMCRSHQTLGKMYYSKGEREKSIHHFEVALGIASRFEWHNRIFWIHYALAKLCYKEYELDEAQVHIAQAKLHAVDDKFCLGRAMEIQARIWLKQGRIEDARPEALGAKEIFEKFWAAGDLERVGNVIQRIERAMES